MSDLVSGFAGTQAQATAWQVASRAKLLDGDLWANSRPFPNLASSLLHTEVYVMSLCCLPLSTCLEKDPWTFNCCPF